MMGQQQAGGALTKRIVLVVLVAALMVLTMASSATPALAIAPQGQEGKDNGQCQKHAHQTGLRGHVICVVLP